jgi:hypothetical protein
MLDGAQNQVNVGVRGGFQLRRIIIKIKAISL